MFPQREFSKKGKWKLSFDSYPLISKHAESVVILSHKNADIHINVNVEFGEGGGEIPVGKITEKAKDYKPSEK